MFGGLRRFFINTYTSHTPEERWQAAEPAPTDVIQLGEAAQRLLEDPVLLLALERVQTKLLDSWRHTELGEIEAREAAYRLYWTSEQFRSELRIMLGNARGAAARRAA